MKNILLVEAAPGISGLLNLHFNSELYKVISCSNGKEAIETFSKVQFKLIMLDITLPDINGMELCKKFRKSNENVPIMMLTCLGDETDKVLALELGADDYVTKPFGILELMARTRALLRRSEKSISDETNLKPEIIFKDLVINLDKTMATVRGERLELTQKEFNLLALLAGSPGKSFTRYELLEQIWGVTFEGYEHTITSHINRLRIKIESDLQHPEYILTSWGTGYRFSE